MREEYGGYFELEQNYGPELHGEGLALNCGRRALGFLLEKRRIRKLYVPAYMCECVLLTCAAAGTEIVPYRINEQFLPQLSPAETKGHWVYLANFYGQLSNARLESYRQQYGRVIVDNAQAFFQEPLPGVDTIYTCRKYFGVTDGAYLISDLKGQEEKLPQDSSVERFHYVLGKYEQGSPDFYREYAANNERFDAEPIKRMSKITRNLMRGIDMERVRLRRQQNFEYLNRRLGRFNELTVRPVAGAFMYPLLHAQGARLKADLITRRLYVPTLWPNVLDSEAPDSLEYRLANDLVLLPCDQRYDTADMKEIVRNFTEVLKIV